MWTEWRTVVAAGKKSALDFIDEIYAVFRFILFFFTRKIVK